jgi:hypothetical protein
VFKQVRESRLAGHFVFRANVVPHVNRNNGSLMILMYDNSQSIAELEFFERDIYRLTVRALRQHGRCERQT